MSDLNSYIREIEGLGSVAAKNRAWLESHKDIFSSLNKALVGLNELPSAIPIFSGSGENFTTIHPWHHLFFEAEQDLHQSVLLLLMGFYKDSFRTLRSFLELYVFGLYHFVSNDEADFATWLAGKAYTPRFGELLKTLPKKNSNFKLLNERLEWESKIQAIYENLSGFIHTRGAVHTHTALSNSNTISFSETGIQKGSEFIIKTIQLVSMGFSTNFPMTFQPLPLFEKFAFNQPAGGFLEEDQVERIRAIFNKEVADELSKISFANEDAVSLADGVRSLPNLSEEEIIQSLKQTLDSEEFKNNKEDIIQMLKEGKANKAFAYTRAIQRAMARAINGILFNPFYAHFGMGGSENKNELDHNE